MVMQKYPHIPNDENDEATERLNLIRLGKREGYTEALREVQSFDIAAATVRHNERLHECEKTTGDIPSWWKGVVTLPVTVIDELTKKYSE